MSAICVRRTRNLAKRREASWLVSPLHSGVQQEVRAREQTEEGTTTDSSSPKQPHRSSPLSDHKPTPSSLPSCNHVVCRHSPAAEQDSLPDRARHGGQEGLAQAVLGRRGQAGERAHLPRLQKLRISRATGLALARTFGIEAVELLGRDAQRSRHMARNAGCAVGRKRERGEAVPQPGNQRRPREPISRSASRSVLFSGDTLRESRITLPFWPPTAPRLIRGQPTLTCIAHSPPA